MSIAPGHLFGKIVRQFRLDHDIKEQEFYTRVGRSKSWLHYFERGKKGYYERTANAIFNAYPQLRERIQKEGAMA